jgi:hypothetical protein
MHSLKQFVAAACGAFACIAVLGAAPATASTVYTVNFFTPLHSGLSALVTGTITTDGSIGVLQPEAFLYSDLTTALCFPVFPGPTCQSFPGAVPLIGHPPR